MPELPEVETVVRTLETLIKDCEILNIQSSYQKIVAMNFDEFNQLMIHQHFRDFKRRGKYLLFEMDDHTLVSHLRMEGKFYVLNQNEPLFKHTHISFLLDNGQRLDYVDVRKFGRFEIIEKQSDYEDFKLLGPEPFSERFNETYVRNAIKGKKCCLKQMLLDQSFVAGVGNIYADEICFGLKLHPETPVQKLTKQKRIELIEVTQAVLTKAIKAGGSTIRSYTSSLGVTGLFQLQIEVYGRKKEPCHVCGTPIEKSVVAGRGTHFCPKCQKKRG